DGQFHLVVWVCRPGVVHDQGGLPGEDGPDGDVHGLDDRCLFCHDSPFPSDAFVPPGGSNSGACRRGDLETLASPCLAVPSPAAPRPASPCVPAGDPNPGAAIPATIEPSPRLTSLRLASPRQATPRPARVPGPRTPVTASHPPVKPSPGRAGPHRAPPRPAWPRLARHIRVHEGDRSPRTTRAHPARRYR